MPILWIAGLLLATPAQDGAKPTLVVAPLRTIGVDSNAGQIVSEQVRALIGADGSFTLVSPEEMDALDDELARQLSGGCAESSCITQIGGALGAQFLISGSLGKMGETYVLNLKLIDIETASAKRTAKPVMKPSLDEIATSTELAVNQLLGKKAVAVLPPGAGQAPPTTTQTSKASGVTWPTVGLVGVVIVGAGVVFYGMMLGISQLVQSTR